ncbi:MAG: hypothetical protein RR250_04025 [Akkermansia sp.]
MHTIPTISAIILVCLSLTSCSTTRPEEAEWRDQLHSNLAVLGARNWIVIAESSFPSYAGAGVKTMVVEQPSDIVFSQVLDSIETEGHVQPRIMVCSELAKISEDYAPGIKKYRNRVTKLLPGRMHFELPHRIINGQVEDAIKQFNVLVIKTTTGLPYSNIYIELDSGYWSSESETALRAKLEGNAQTQSRRIIPIPLPETPSPEPKDPKGTKETKGTNSPSSSDASDSVQSIQSIQSVNPKTDTPAQPAQASPQIHSSIDQLPALPKNDTSSTGTAQKTSVKPSVPPSQATPPSTNKQ